MEVPQGVPKPLNCPRCGAPAMMIHRLNKSPPGKCCGRGGGLPWQQTPP
jgi:ribosomal protein S27AE